MTNKIKKMIKKRNKAWKRYNDAPQYRSLRKYKKLRNGAIKEIRLRKKLFEEELADKIKTEPKAFYSYVRSKTKTKQRVGPLLDNRGKLTDDKNSMCSILNEYFSTVFTVEDTSNIPELILRDDNYQPIIIQDKFTMIDINESTVLSAMANQKVN